MSYSPFPHVGMGYFPSLPQRHHFDSSEDRERKGKKKKLSRKTASVPNLQMPTFESPFAGFWSAFIKDGEKRKKKPLNIEHNFKPLPDCIVENDEEMPVSFSDNLQKSKYGL